MRMSSNESKKKCWPIPWGSSTVFTSGMPSSHSAMVAALTTGVGNTEGVGSPLFAASAVFALIVMYDATGVRIRRVPATPDRVRAALGRFLRWHHANPRELVGTEQPFDQRRGHQRV